MKKTWDERYERWLKRVEYNRSWGIEAAYLAGRRHQKEALREQGRAWRERIDKLFRIIDDRNYEIQDLARERNECRLDCDVLIQEKSREEEKHMAQHIIYRQKIDECESLKYSRDYIQIQNGSLKNQIRILRETIVNLESRSWWQKFWKVDW